jgi:LCP family protein required for cell wall assembly
MRAVTSGNDTADIGSKIIPIKNDPEYALPENSDDRLDILLLGIRGEDDVQNGGLLTDTIMLFSLDTNTGRAALTSIPRDFTVRVTDEKTEKINTAYIHNGTNGSKRLFSRITGVAIDHIVAIDFQAFQQIIDTLGGVTIFLDQPFEESQQWAGEGAGEEYVFSLPEGENVLNGEQALYYVRSRYSSSDFDRSRRQMQVMLAIKAKVEGLNLMSDPLTALSLANTLRSHIDTDMDIFDLGTLKQLMDQGDQLTKVRRYQLTTENFLYETRVDGIYELLPRGDSLSYLKAFFASILDDKPVMTAPTLTPSPSTTPVSSSTP